MVCVAHLVVSLFILGPPLGISGYSISSRGSKVTPTTKQPDGIANLKAERETSTTQPPTLLGTLDVSREVPRVKREVAEEDVKVNELSYDPSLMAVSKRSAAALNKLMLALRSSLDEPSGNSYEGDMDSEKENGRYSKSGFRTGGSGYNFETFPSNALQRRGQKDRKIYLRCYFNAVSCF